MANIEHDSESLIIEKTSNGWIIGSQHDQSGSTQALTISDDIYLQFKNHFLVSDKQEWIKEQMPEFDGHYLVHILRRNECGTFSSYQKVVEVRKAQWIIDEGEMITHYRKVDNPDFSMKITQS